MVNPNHFLTILSLLPLSLAIVLPDNFDSSPSHKGRTLPVRDTRTTSHAGNVRWLPRRATKNTPTHRRRNGRIQGPRLRRGGVEVAIQRRTTAAGLEKRSTENGSIINLGTALETYVLPVTIGTPPVTYPLQLDLGSSDLLIASTLCGSNCPSSLGPTTNPYYDVSKTSSSLTAVNKNQSTWEIGFADGRTARGFIAQEKVVFGEAVVTGQVIGMMNQTNLTLSEQQISGILGLGFPRLSVLARTLLQGGSTSSSATSSSASTSSAVASGSASASSAGSAAATASSSASSSTTSAGSSSYLPPLLESLVTTPHIPYPVFGLALSSPPASATSSTSSAKPSASIRFQSNIGSLTLGGVSSLYVSSQAGSGRTVDDIEWHDVIPFGRAITDTQAKEGSITTLGASSGLSISGSPTTSAIPTSSAAVQKRQDDETTASTTSIAGEVGGVPISETELAGEEYLYWAVELRNISVNGTDIGLTPVYDYLHVPPIALLDAGFNGIAGPPSEVAKIFAQIPDARQTSIGQWAAPCNTRKALGFSFGGRYIQLQPEDWLFAQIADSSFCLAWPIATSPTGDGIDWQLGTPFLKNVYSVFSYGINGEQAPLVGFLPLAEDVVSASTSASGSSATSSSVAASVSSGSTSISTSSTPSASPYGPVPTTIVAFTPTTTVRTTIPNAVLGVPTYSLPTYIYSIDPTITQGAIQNIGLANASAYDVGEVPIISPYNLSTMTTTPAGGVGSVGGSSVSDSGQTGGAMATRNVGCSGMVLMGVCALVGLWL